MVRQDSSCTPYSTAASLGSLCIRLAARAPELCSAIAQVRARLIPGIAPSCTSSRLRHCGTGILLRGAAFMGLARHCCLAVAYDGAGTRVRGGFLTTIRSASGIGGLVLDYSWGASIHFLVSNCESSTSPKIASVITHPNGIPMKCA
jgi:hypothetical protein